jgi:transposase
VSQWLKRGREQRVEALHAHPPQGRKPRLTDEQKAQIPQVLAKGAEAYGFRGDVWTARRVARVIERTDHEFATTAITWAACYVRQGGVGNNRLNEQRNATSKPSKSGMRSDGPLLKKAQEEQRTIVWVDEAGFYLLPMAVRTWAPRGQTPVLRVPLTRDHLAAISAITLDGRLFMQVRQASYDSIAVVGFLRVLLRKVSGKILLIWDGSPIHRGHAIKAFLKRGAAKRLHLEQLPGYAPDLNPDKGIWNYLKRVELGNVCSPDVKTLQAELLRARERVRHKRQIITACVLQRGYGSS